MTTLNDTQARRFRLNRIRDISGVSGTGIVAHGIEFPNGRVALSWTSDHTTITVYDCADDVITIHGHEGATSLEWLDR